MFGGSKTNFGQSGFGFPTTTSSTFGNTSAFGQTQSVFLQPSNTMFNSSQPSLFGSTTTQVTATPQQQSAFGGAFSQTQQTPNVFGGQTTTQTPIFGQQTFNKPGFAFNSTQQNQPTQQVSLFGSNNNATTAARPTTGFGNFGGQTMNAFGAPTTLTDQSSVGSSLAKYQPSNGTDTLIKNGQQNNVSTRQHCITAMKEYENKSLEEIRLEDYVANRKGGQIASGANLFGTAQPAPINIFNNTNAQPTTDIFGAQTENKSLFGQTNSVFGQPSNSTFLNSSTNNFIAKPFAATTSAAVGSFSFNTAADTNSPMFGNKTFGNLPTATATTNLFGQTTQQPTSSIFGQTPAFGAANQPVATAAGNTTFSSLANNNNNASGFGTFNLNSNAPTNNLFAAKTNTSFNSATGFGQAQPTASTSFPAFSSATNTTGSIFNNSANKISTSTFGGFNNLSAPLSNVLTNTNNTSSMFSNNANKSVGFGLGNFNKPTNSIFPTNNNSSAALIGIANSNNINLSAQLSKTLINQQLLSKVVSPYGDNPLFKDFKTNSLGDNDKTSIKATNSSKMLLNSEMSQYKLMNRKSDTKTTPIRNVLTKKSLFEGLEEFDNSIDECFNIKNNNKRLLLQTKKSNPPTPTMAPPQKIIDESQRSKPEISNEHLEEPKQQDSWLRPNFMDKEKIPIEESVMDNTIKELVTKNSIVTSIKTSKIRISNEDFGNNEESEVISKNSANIILSRPGYFTIPAMDELNSYVSYDGKCNVPNFTIGRKGYGNVFFDIEMDISGLNLDEIIHFRHKEVIVYPDDNNKPKIGFGLNREAQITLDQVWPQDKTTHEPITDSQKLVSMDFEGKLRRVCDKKDVRFIEYRPETGSWVFRVKHFSKYGLSDSDDEDDIQILEKVKDVSKEKKVKKIIINEGKKSTIEIRNDSKIDFQIHDDNIEIETPSSFFGSVTSNIGEQSGTNVCKLQLMKATYFVDDTQSYENLIYDDNNAVSEEPMEIPLRKPNTTVIEEREYTLKPDILTKHGFDTKLNKIFEQKCISDIALLNHHRRKATFGPKNVLLVPVLKSDKEHKDYNSINLMSTSENRHIEIFRIKNDISMIAKINILEHLKINLKNSLQIDQENSECPFIQLKDGGDVIYEYIKIYKKGDTETSYDDFVESVWTLTSALWSEENEISENSSIHHSIMYRRNKFSNWIENICNALKSGESDCIPERKLYIDHLTKLVCCHKVNEACELAIKNKDITLSLLLSQLSSNISIRQIIEDQLASWTSNSLDKYINVQRLKLFMLIAGIPIMDSCHGTLCTFDNIHWLMVLAGHLWYISSPTSSIIATVNNFDEYCNNSILNIQQPFPEFVSATENGIRTYDLRYHVLKLYANSWYALEKILNNSTHTPYPLDNVLSWLLLKVFENLGYKHCTELCKNKIHEDFANQLESMDLWEWSIFVLLHISAIDKREISIQNVLFRNLSLNNAESEIKEKFIINNLGIPKQWIDTIKAIYANSFGLHWKQVKYLLHANKWNKAHDIIYNHIAPPSIINGNFYVVSNLLKPIENTVSNRLGTLPSWNAKGDILMKFIDLKNQMAFNSTDCVELLNPIEVRSKLVHLISRIHALPCPTTKHILCQSELSQHLSTILRNFCLEGSKSVLNKELKIALEKLELPQEFTQKGLQSILNLI